MIGPYTIVKSDYLYGHLLKDGYVVHDANKTRITDELSKDDANRIMVCMNACEGFTTSELEEQDIYRNAIVVLNGIRKVFNCDFASLMNAELPWAVSKMRSAIKEIKDICGYCPEGNTLQHSNEIMKKEMNRIQEMAESIMVLMDKKAY